LVEATVTLTKTVFLRNQATEGQFRMSKKSLKMTPKTLKDIILTAQHENKQKNVIKHFKKLLFMLEKEWKHCDLFKYVVEHLEKPFLIELAGVEDTATKAAMYKWQKKFDKFMEQELKKLYSLIWGQCTEVMKNELKAVTDFKEIERTEDAIHIIKKNKGITLSFQDQNMSQDQLVCL